MMRQRMTWALRMLRAERKYTAKVSPRKGPVRVGAIARRKKAVRSDEKTRRSHIRAGTVTSQNENHQATTRMREPPTALEPRHAIRNHTSIDEEAVHLLGYFDFAGEGLPSSCRGLPFLTRCAMTIADSISGASVVSSSTIALSAAKRSRRALCDRRANSLPASDPCTTSSVSCFYFG